MKKHRIIREQKTPPSFNLVGRPPKYPWRELRPNTDDSFFVQGVSRGTISSLATLAAQRIGNGCRFTVKTEETGIRVWRVS